VKEKKIISIVEPQPLFCRWIQSRSHFIMAPALTEFRIIRYANQSFLASVFAIQKSQKP